ncbi:hypothetical protein ACMFMG_010774 [Clarireedia jacksonii]
MPTVESDEHFPINILVGDHVRSTTKGQFLKHIWTDYFDSGRPEDLTEANPSTICLRIHNRHLHCIIERQIQYVPVSHAWHERVALAHISKLSNDEAEEVVYNTAIQILIAATEKLGPNIEVWHDYISVPQWQRDAQQRLLLQLPAIFSYPTVTLIHLDDFSAHSLKEIFRTASPTTYVLSHVERLREIAKFYNARWHQRMWTALELAHSRRACILTQDYVVLTDERYMSDSFFFFLEYFNHATKSIGQEVGNTRFMPLAYELRFRELAYLRKETNPSFGEVFNLIAQKDCRDYRDRHLAIASFLGLKTHDELCEQFHDKTTDEVCEWTWKETLKQGDCGPLLLVQSPISKLKYPYPRWIAGGREMKADMWGLGSLLRPPTITICTSIAESLRLKLQHVGSTTQIRFYSSNSDSTLEEGFRRIINVALSSSQCCTASGFVAALNRLYPTSLEGSITTEIPTTVEGYIQVNPSFIQVLEELLAEFRSESDEDQTIHQQNIAQKIIDLLSMSSSHYSSIGRFSRMEWLTFQHHAPYMPAIAMVRCYTCSQCFPFLLELLGKPNGIAEVYRIPDLHYSNTLRNGVGIVVSNKEIIGRMYTGTPACQCNRLVDLEL